MKIYKYNILKKGIKIEIMLIKLLYLLKEFIKYQNGGNKYQLQWK